MFYMKLSIGIRFSCDEAVFPACFSVALLGRDKPSVLVCLYIMNYKEESIVSSNIVYANENKIMRRNTKKMSRFIAYSL